MQIFGTIQVAANSRETTFAKKDYYRRTTYIGMVLQWIIGRLRIIISVIVLTTVQVLNLEEHCDFYGRERFILPGVPSRSR